MNENIENEYRRKRNEGDFPTRFCKNQFHSQEFEPEPLQSCNKASEFVLRWSCITQIQLDFAGVKPRTSVIDPFEMSIVSP